MAKHRRRTDRDREYDRKRGNTRAGQRQPARNWTHPCANCGVPFTSRTSRTYCGDGCRSVAALTRWRPASPRSAPEPTHRRCGFCDLPSGTRKWCSERCFNLANGRAQLAIEVRTGHCRRCGNCYCVPKTVAPGFCSAACSRRQLRKRLKAHRRARTGRSQDFTLREIAERDGWCCHLCGGKVPDRQYAARDDDPTLDHLVPVSKGGPHARDNVALAHNRCNWERGDTDLEFQLRLVD